MSLTALLPLHVPPLYQPRVVACLPTVSVPAKEPSWIPHVYWGQSENAVFLRLAKWMSKILELKQLPCIVSFWLSFMTQIITIISCWNGSSALPTWVPFVLFSFCILLLVCSWDVCTQVALCRTVLYSCIPPSLVIPSFPLITRSVLCSINPLSFVLPLCTPLTKYGSKLLSCLRHKPTCTLLFCICSFNSLDVLDNVLLLFSTETQKRDLWNKCQRALQVPVSILPSVEFLGIIFFTFFPVPPPPNTLHCYRCEFPIHHNNHCWVSIYQIPDPSAYTMASWAMGIYSLMTLIKPCRYEKN